ncbi:MAG: mgtE [Devosia sp.]|nr:mgtE [Devosia sp.]
MSEDDHIAAEPDAAADPFALRDESGHVNAAWIERLRGHLHGTEVDDRAEIAAMIEPLHAADTGDVLEALESFERLELIRSLGDRFDYSVLTEVDESIRAELTDDLPNAEIARGLRGIDSDDAVTILEDLDDVDKNEILGRLPAFERLSLKRSLDYPEESAGRRMQTDFIAIPPFWDVGQTIDYLRAEKELPEEFYQIYVVDAAYHVIGIVALDRLLRSERPQKVDAIMNDVAHTVEAAMDQEAAAHVFERYDLVEVGVIDDSERLVGVLTIDDIVDIIHEEVSEDMRMLAGVGDEDISDTVFGALRSRVTWLVVNLVTAILASLVIGLFDATLEQMVALAVLMPIVASMGGNAGTQTMTVTVRALAMRELDSRKIRRLIIREMLVGVLNGGIFAVLIGLITAVRFANPGLGAVIAMAMVINMIAAGTAGILIPLGLDRLKIDPAIASSVFVTTITDVIGFFAFLGLASLWFGLF